jgi:hypothetical protein
MITILKSGRSHHLRDPQGSGSVMPSGPPALNVKLELAEAAYLRAAHAYMLISMPTGTSTIFGVFQAILALLL